MKKLSLRRAALLAVCLMVGTADRLMAGIVVKASEFPSNLDVSVDGKPLLERVNLEIKPRGADLPRLCAWTLPAPDPASPGLVSVRCHADDIEGSVRFQEMEEGVVAVTLDLDREAPMSAEDGIRLTAGVAGFERGMALIRSEPWWMRPVFFSQQNYLPDETQLVLCRRGGGYTAVLPLAAGGAAGWARGANVPIAAGGVRVGFQAWAPWSVQHAPLAVVSAGASPYAAVASAYRRGLEVLGRPGRLRGEKPYPEPLTRIGFCSWNSFYEEQTTANLMGAARAFQAAHFPIGFMIIDAGWQLATPGSIFVRRLQSFQADTKKIPGGLKELLDGLRTTSGARWMGVWHALQGTPGGVDPASALAKEEADHLWQGAYGSLLPDPTSAKGEGFYRDFYRYLKESGVDLVKVDFQNWTEFYLHGRVPVFAGLQQSVHNLQAAAKEAFGGALINCMSMGNNALLSLQDTNVVRNSLDYLLPEGPVGHRRHILNNIFNSVAVQQVAYPDFDMWEAYGDFATYHSVLRALSGGPVYITGDVAKQDWNLLRRLILADGTVLRTDDPVLPTRDSLFVDAGLTAVPLKGFTRVGTTGILGVFNALESGGAVSGELRPGDVDGIGGTRFATLEYFSHRLSIGGADDAIPLKLAANEAQLYWVAPIQRGIAAFGLLEKYVAPKTLLSQEDDGRTLRLKLAEGGTLGVYVEQAPSSTRVDGAPVTPRWTGGLLQVPIENGAPKTHLVEITR